MYVTQKADLFKPKFDAYDKQMGIAAKLPDSQAEAAYIKISQSPQYHFIPETYLALARLYIRLQQYDLAEATCQKILTTAPYIAEANKLLASVFIKQKKSITELTNTVLIYNTDLKQTRLWHYHRLRSTLTSKAAIDKQFKLPVFADPNSSTDTAYLESSEYFHIAHKACEHFSYDIAAYYFEKAHKTVPHDFISLTYIAYLGFIPDKSNASNETDYVKRTDITFKQLDFVIERFDYNRARILRAVFNKNSVKAANSDYKAALKKYICEDYEFFNNFKPNIFLTLVNSTIGLPSVQSTSAETTSAWFEAIALNYLESKNYDEALLYYGFALWFEKECLQPFSLRMSHLFIMRAHIHLIKNNSIADANYAIHCASRFIPTGLHLFDVTADYETDRLATHALLNQGAIRPGNEPPIPAYLLKISAAKLFLQTEYPQIGMVLLNKTIAEYPDYPTAYAIRASHLEAAKLYVEARIDVTTALFISPNHPSLLQQRININQYIPNSIAEKMLDKSRKATALIKKNYSDTWYSALLQEQKIPIPAEDVLLTFYLGAEAIFSKKYDLSIYYFLQILHKNPTDFVAETWLGLAQFYLGNLDIAMMHFTNCREKYPLAHLGQGLVHSAREEFAAAAISFSYALGNTKNLDDWIFFEDSEKQIKQSFAYLPEKLQPNPEELYTQALTQILKQDYQYANILLSRAIWAKDSAAVYEYYFQRSFCCLKIGYPGSAYADALHGIHSATLHQISEEEIMKLKTLFTLYCLNPVASALTKVTDYLGYYTFGLKLNPSAALLQLRAKHYDSMGLSGAAANDREEASALIAAQNQSNGKNSKKDKKKKKKTGHRQPTPPKTKTKISVAHKKTDDHTDELVSAPVNTVLPKPEKKHKPTIEVVKFDKPANSINADFPALPRNTPTIEVAEVKATEEVVKPTIQGEVTKRKPKKIRDRRTKTPKNKKAPETNKDSVSPTADNESDHESNNESTVVSEGLSTKDTTATSSIVELKSNPDSAIITEPTADIVNQFNAVAAPDSLPLIRLDSIGSTDSSSDNDTSYSSPSFVKSDSSDSMVEEITDTPQLPATEQIALPAVRTSAISPRAAEFIYRPALFSPIPPMEVTTANLRSYMPSQCDFHPIEQAFMDELAKLEKQLKRKFEIYIVGGSLTDRVLKQYKQNLMAITNKSEALKKYLSHAMFNRDLDVVDDLDMFTTLPLNYVEQIGRRIGLTPKKRYVDPSAKSWENHGIDIEVEFMSFTRQGQDNFKVDVVYQETIDLAVEARKRDSGLVMPKNRVVEDISGFGFMDLVRGIVRITTGSITDYHIEALKIMHVIHTSTKRFLTIHEYEKLKHRPWLTFLFKPSYLNSALYKLFSGQRSVENFKDLHQLKVFEKIFTREISHTMEWDQLLIRRYLQNPENLPPKKSLYHLHALFIASHVMQKIMAHLGNSSQNLTIEMIDTFLSDKYILDHCHETINSLNIFKTAFSKATPDEIDGALLAHVNSWKLAHQIEEWIGQNLLIPHAQHRRTRSAIKIFDADNAQQQAYDSQVAYSNGAEYSIAQQIAQHRYGRNHPINRSQSTSPTAGHHTQHALFAETYEAQPLTPHRRGG